MTTPRAIVAPKSRLAIAVLTFCLIAIGSPLLAVYPSRISTGEAGAGAGSSGPWFSGTMGTKSLFVAYAQNSDFSLWITDGTEAGTSLVITFPYPYDAVDSNGYPYNPTYGFIPQPSASPAVFTTWTADKGNQYWKTDGTAEGTQVLTTNASRASMLDSAIIGSWLYYIAEVDFKTELWRVNIESGVSSQVTKFNPSGDDQVLIFLVGDPTSGLFVLANDGVSRKIYRATDAGVSRFGPDNATFAVTSGNTTFLMTSDTVRDDQPDSFSVWKSDGITNTLLLSGVLSVGFTPLGDGRLFMAANDGVHGREPWISDGTPEGTKLIADLNPGRGDSNPKFSKGLNGDWYIFTDDHAIPQLYRYQPQSGALNFLKAGIQLRSPGVAIGSYWYFGSTDQEHGTGIWKTDGTTAGTSYAGIAPPVHPDGVELLGSVGSQLLMSCGDGTHGIEPWVSDGTTAGTKLLLDCIPGGRDFDMVPAGVMGTSAFFTSTRLDADGNSIRDLWSTDGTSAGTHLAVPLNNAPIDSFVANAARLFYIRRDATPHLFGSDGTAAGTLQLAAVPPGLGNVIPFQNGAAFVGSDPQRSRALYVTDGTSNGTVAVTPAGTFVDGPLTASSAYIYFFVTGASTELWRSDGSAAGTARVLTLPSYDAQSITPTVVVGNTFFFYIASANQLWKSDGTSNGTTVVATIAALTNLWNVNGSLLALAGSELWKSEATGASPVLVKSRIAAPAPIAGASLVMGNVLYWHSSILGFSQLWRSDGTTEGTYPLVHFAPFSSLIPPRLAVANGHVFFCGEERVHHRQLWMTDGTRETTHQVQLGGSSSAWSTADNFMVSGNLLFFGSGESSYQKDLFVYDTSTAPANTIPPAITITGATLSANGLTLSGTSMTTMLNYTYSGASNGHGAMTTGYNWSVNTGPDIYHPTPIPLNHGTTDVYLTVIDSNGVSNEVTLTFNGGVWLPSTPVPPPTHRRATN
jgi:ELWxxDGT repeat protein